MENISKRLLIAKEVMCALLSNPEFIAPPNLAKLAFEYADQLLEQEDSE